MARDETLAALSGFAKGITRELESRRELGERRRERKEAREERASERRFRRTEAEQQRAFEIAQLEKRLSQQAEQFAAMQGFHEARTQEILERLERDRAEQKFIESQRTEEEFTGIDPATGEEVSFPLSREQLQAINAQRALGISQRQQGVSVDLPLPGGGSRTVRLTDESAAKVLSEAERNREARRIQALEMHSDLLKTLAQDSFGNVTPERMLEAVPVVNKISRSMFPEFAETLFPPEGGVRVPTGQGGMFLSLVSPEITPESRAMMLAELEALRQLEQTEGVPTTARAFGSAVGTGLRGIGRGLE